MADPPTASTSPYPFPGPTTSQAPTWLQDGGAWVERTNSSQNSWSSVASSSSGQNLVAVFPNSAIYTSTTYGLGWTSQNVPYGTWYDVTSCSSGQYLLAASWSTYLAR